MQQDDAGRAMGDAGKGSFEESQEKAADQDWHAQLKDQLVADRTPREERTPASGPGRGRS